MHYEVIDNRYHFKRPISRDELLRVAEEALAANFVRGAPITSPEEAGRFFRAKLSGRKAQVFVALFLDNRHRVIQYRELFQGTLDSTPVYPREVARAAIELNAAACMVASCRPSGATEPSAMDRVTTDKLRDALNLIDVRLLDHFVIGDGHPVSFAARGLL